MCFIAFILTFSVHVERLLNLFCCLKMQSVIFFPLNAPLLPLLPFEVCIRAYDGVSFLNAYTHSSNHSVLQIIIQ